MLPLIPAVILRSGHHGGLGIVRSLGRAGVAVYTVDAHRWEPAFTSRFCRRRFILDTGEASPDQSVCRLLEIGRMIGGHPLLIPTTDQTTVWVADHAEALRERYCFPQQDPAMLRLLCDKHRMQDLARRAGVSTAQAMVPRSARNIEEFLDTATFPVIAKATDSDRFRGYTGGTKFILHTPRELIELYNKVVDRDDPAFMIQEFIPGDDWMFDGYFDSHSECLFGLSGKKIRRFPVDTGVTSLGICLRNDAVEQTTARFMKAIGYRGILDIGYRYDRRDGQYKVLDVNPRIGCTFRLFCSGDGIDVARALYLDITGQVIPPATGAEGRKWIVEDFDMVSSLRLLRNRSLKLQDWLGSFRGIQEGACFAWDDPLPFFIMALADFGEMAQWLRCQVRSRKSAAGAQMPSSSISAR